VALAQQDPDIPTASVVTKVTKQHGHTFGSLRDQILREGRDGR
jgi:hypothetical protein